MLVTLILVASALILLCSIGSEYRPPREPRKVWDYELKRWKSNPRSQV